MAGLNPLYPAPDKWRPGDNLLDNWYFVNPVNQEGNTFASSSNAHLIDRWKICAYVNGTATVTDTGVSLAGQLDFGQTIESGRIPRTPGTEITISCLLSTGELFWKTQKLANNIASEDVLTPLPPYGYLHFARHWPSIEANTDLFYFSVNCETQFSVVAAMLEPGPEQHLAHKEGNAWVLNRVPDYREELAKCKYYQRVFYRNNTLEKITLVGYTYGSQLIFPFLSSMAKVPAIVAEDDAVEVRVVGHDGPISVTAMNAMAGPSDYGLIITINTSTTFQGDNVALLFVKNMKKLIFDAN